MSDSETTAPSENGPDPLQPGKLAPDFELPGTINTHGDIEQYSLSKATEDGPCVLNFYLFDHHPACTENLCDLHRVEWFDVDLEVTVYGISADSVYSHRTFADAQDLDYPLLSDSAGRVAAEYGVLIDEFDGHEQVANRAVFVVGAERRIEYAWAAGVPSEQPEWGEVRDAVGRAKGDI